jgi:hypothetical protein
VPDGEPGGRRLWISWQWPVLRAHAALREVVPPPREGGLAVLEVVPGTDPATIEFGELGYAREARISYQDFRGARERGWLPEGVKFQVSLPTPFAIISTFLDPESAQVVLPAYSRAMFAEVKRIADAIPHEDLALQWDVCIEMIIWDGQPSIVPSFPGAREIVTATLKSCLKAVPSDIELGVHLCYGDYDARHFIEPVDAGAEVELANTILDLAGRPLAWIHMPVPVARTDDAFYAPLADLKLQSQTRLYLGLIHGRRQRQRADRRRPQGRPRVWCRYRVRDRAPTHPRPGTSTHPRPRRGHGRTPDYHIARLQSLGGSPTSQAHRGCC